MCSGLIHVPLGKQEKLGPNEVWPQNQWSLNAKVRMSPWRHSGGRKKHWHIFDGSHLLKYKTTSARR